MLSELESVLIYFFDIGKKNAKKYLFNFENGVKAL